MANPFSQGYTEIVKSRVQSKRDVPAHLKVKYRDSTDNEQHSGNLKEDLEIRENLAVPLAITDTSSHEYSVSHDSERQSSDFKKFKTEPDINPLDKDDSDSSNEENYELNEDDEDDEEMAELERELERLKKERLAEASARERERIEREAKDYHEKMLSGNELLFNPDITVKKKWYEETIFRNQACDEPKYQKRFVNDTVRNDFHIRFLNKYVK